MEHLLYLVHRIPYPPNKGDKIRSYHLLRHLTQRYTVHLGAFVDHEADWKYADALSSLVTGTVKLIPLDKRQATLRSSAGLLAGLPLTLPYYHDAGMRHWVARTLTEHPVRQALVFSSAMAQYLEPYPQLRRVIDLVDLDSDKWLQYAQQSAWPMSAIYRREARTLLAYERRLASQFDATTFVSAAEAEAFRKLAPESSDRISHFNNGVDLDYFSPDHELPTPYPQRIRALVFTGAMDYWPNVDAVTWFAREVFPALRAQFSELHFYIVGSHPSAAVKALAGNGVMVTGEVGDVRPYLAHAALSVAPLRIARGIQNKVLEAMAMAKTVIASPEALEGIHAQVGQDLLSAQDSRDFITQISAQLTRPDPALGLAARRCVEHAYSWDTSLVALDRLLAQASADE